MTQQPTDLENKAVFEQLWGLTNELRQKIDARFELHPDPSTKNLQSYSATTGGAHGSLKTFSGSERAALSKRDLIVRRAIAERDPDNQIAVRLFGAELTDKLVRSN